MPAPPYRIESPRLVLRCWSPEDSPLLKEAIDASLEHLRPWLPWAHAEPQTVEEKVALLRGFRSRFDADEDYVYGVFSRDEGAVLGGTGLHTRAGPDALEIGYWVRAGETGKGLATELAAALTRAAFLFAGVDRVEVHVDPANVTSLRVPAKLGFVEEATLRRRLPPKAPGGPLRDATIFSMLVEEFAGSPADALSAATLAFDAAGHAVAPRQ